MMEQNKFKRYDSPEQYAEAFQQMIDAREKWREQVREQSRRRRLHSDTFCRHTKPALTLQVESVG